MRIYVGADHQGFSRRTDLIKYLRQAGYEVEDEGDKSLNPEDDYPQFAGRVAMAILASKDSEPRGIILCGSGQGVCMAANRFKGIRACVGYDEQTIHAARNDDDSNVLCIPAARQTPEETYHLTQTWLTTPFSGAVRYTRRNQELDELG